MEKRKRSNSGQRVGGPKNNNMNNNVNNYNNFNRGGWSSGYRGNNRGNRGYMRGNYRNNYNNNYNFRNNNMNNMNRGMYNNRRGAPYRRYQQNGVRGGYIQKRYNNNHMNNNYYHNNFPVQNHNNLRRSRSSMSLNRMSFNMNPRNSFSPYRGEDDGGGGVARFGRLSRSRSRSNLGYRQNDSYSLSPNRNFLQRTSSMPDLRDEEDEDDEDDDDDEDDSETVYSRLGYQNTAQANYRNRVQKSRNPSMNRNKNLKMHSALQVLIITFY